MITFILNHKTIETDMPKGMTVLDFVRYQKQLMGTKIGCREGDCGACTVLIGELSPANDVIYSAMTSCLLPLANVQNKHVVTIEGINSPKDLTPVQQFMVEESGTQCGFCTVGFVMSMTGFSLQNGVATEGSAIAAIDGNICRCTGYKSIERASKRLVGFLNENEKGQTPLAYAIDNQLVPAYFSNIKQRLQALNQEKMVAAKTVDKSLHFVGGGTDLYVQKHDDMPHLDAQHLFDSPILRGVKLVDNWFEMGASATVSDLKNAPEMNAAFPRLQQYLKLVSSTPIRNMATIAGNLVNASPIGDLTVFLLALDARISLENEQGNTRELALKDFYKGYKMLDKTPDEILTSIRFRQPDENTHFNFEKVCKRTHLDIASVNSAIFLTTNQGIITDARIAFGGVAPIPFYLPKTSECLKNKPITEGAFLEANDVMQTEINPISDVRGSATYKRLLAKKLLIAHFHVLFNQ